MTFHECTGNVHTIDCESDSDDRAGVHRHKPLSLADLGEPMRSIAKGDESAEGRTRTADLRVMNPEEVPQNKGESDALQHQQQQSAAESTVSPPTDADLARVVSAWADLPDAIRRGILAMVDAQG